jgi:hypothetical protein
VSGLLRSSAHVRQARSPRLRCRPGVAVINLGRLPHRARGGHTHRRRPRGGDHSAHIPNYKHFRRVRPHLAGDGPRPVRAGSGLPLVSVRSVRRGSRVKHDFACTLAGAFPPVLVVRRAQSRLGLAGRTRTLSGPSPDLGLTKTHTSLPIIKTWLPSLLAASTIVLLDITGSPLR